MSAKRCCRNDENLCPRVLVELECFDDTVWHCGRMGPRKYISWTLVAMEKRVVLCLMSFRMILFKFFDTSVASYPISSLLDRPWVPAKLSSRPDRRFPRLPHTPAMSDHQPNQVPPNFVSNGLYLLTSPRQPISFSTPMPTLLALSSSPAYPRYLQEPAGSLPRAVSRQRVRHTQS